MGKLNLTKLTKLTVADYYAEFMASKEVPAAFQLSGGMIAFLADAIFRKGVTRLVTNRHEQASGFAAEGATRATGRTSIALGTSGPGATNLITAIASSYFDSIPVLFITGQVNTKELRTSLSQRQNGFQELDIATMVNGITKSTYTPKTAKEAVTALHSGWNLANTGRPGPVLIDLSIDVQQEYVDLEDLANENLTPENLNLIEDPTFTLVNSALTHAKRPLILVGGGVRSDNSIREFSEFVRASNIPVAATLMGLDSVTDIGERYLGFIGSYGNRWANQALGDCDTLLVLGCRLDPRQTGNDARRFKDGKTIIRVDIDQSELDGRIAADIKVKATIRNFLTDQRLTKEKFTQSDLIEVAKEKMISRPQENEQEVPLELNPNTFLEQISKIHKNSNGYIVDVGQHQMWAAQSIHLESHQRFMTSGGLGAMGFSLPAAIGASVSVGGDWIVILGDGCAQLAAPELQTIVDLDLPIVIYVMNNSQHGMVAQFQDENMQSRYVGTREGYKVPNFSELATAYGIKKTFEFTSLSQISDLELFLKNSGIGPALVNVEISNQAKALPKMKFLN